jgi:hypothetical protein
VPSSALWLHGSDIVPPPPDARQDTLVTPVWPRKACLGGFEVLAGVGFLLHPARTFHAGTEGGMRIGSSRVLANA